MEYTVNHWWLNSETPENREKEQADRELHAKFGLRLHKNLYKVKLLVKNLSGWWWCRRVVPSRLKRRQFQPSLISYIRQSLDNTDKMTKLFHYLRWSALEVVMRYLWWILYGGTTIMNKIINCTDVRRKTGVIRKIKIRKSRVWQLPHELKIQRHFFYL